MVPVCHPSWHVFFCALLLVRWSSAEDVTESDLPLYLGWWLYVWDGPRYLKAAAPHLVCNRRVRLFGDRVCYCTLFHIKCQRVILFSCCWLCLSFREHNEVTHFSNITCDTLSPQWLMMEVRRSVGLWTIGSGIELAAQVDGYLATAHDLLHLSTGCCS